MHRSDKDKAMIQQVCDYVKVAAEMEEELRAVGGDSDKFSVFLQKFRSRLLDLKPGEWLLRETP